ncbi:hypothetical protein DWB78_13560 [Halopelagius longus]|uniref:Uncharacterized protein n=1 Tax=Halopelagius longus TaxID=1236180 RepID=A0A370IPU3_9EURY|nr:hypothetical protein DWB78_13560 [Halopelagius longus]
MKLSIFYVGLARRVKENPLTIIITEQILYGVKIENSVCDPFTDGLSPIGILLCILVFDFAPKKCSILWGEYTSRALIAVRHSKANLA